MILYMHPVSATSRPVRLLIAEYDLPCEQVLVDLMTGAHLQEPYASMNPNRLVPMLDDDGFTLTEASAILKYLADKFDLPVYPKPLQARAKVNEAMDWLNTQFYRDFGYGLVYPQLVPHHRRRSDEAQAGCLEWGAGRTQRWLKVLDEHWLGDKPWLCGDTITLADYFGSGVVTLGDLIDLDWSDYPNIRRWMGSLRQLRSWSSVNEMFEGFAAGNRGKAFVHP